MIVQICAVWDHKAQAYLLPYFSSNVAVAMRSFTNAASAKGQLIGDNPQDFTLYHLGTFNDSDGKIVLFEVPKHILGGEQIHRETGDVRKIA